MNMTGVEFEEQCAFLLRRKGYRSVRMTKATGDQGVDLLARKRGRRYAVQCKLSQKPVGNTAIQEVFAGKEYYDCQEALVMTNSTFTKGAQDLAASTDVQLWENVPVKRSGGSRAFSIIFVVIVLAVAAWYCIQKYL